MRLGKNLNLSLAVFVGMLAMQNAKAQEIDYGTLSAMLHEPVTTSATGSPEKASQVPADLQIITADDIRRSGATDIPDILRYCAGIDVRTEGALDNDVSIRGYAHPSNARVLVLIDGRQVYLEDYGYTAWQTLPVQLADIRQIEIVKGPASALFGFNAVSGVINIITYDPLFDKTNVLNFGLGTDGLYEGSLVSTLNIPGKAGVTVQLGGLRTNEFNASPLGSTLPPDSSRPYYGSYAIDGRYKPTSDTEVTLETTQGDANSSVLSPFYSFYTLAYRTNSYKASIAAQTQLGLLTLSAYTNLARISLHPAVAFGPQFENNQVDVIQANDLFKAANVHAIRIGVEYRNNREGGSFINGSLHYNDFAADAMWNWQINPKLSFTLAGRVDHLQLERSDPLYVADRYSLTDYQNSSFTTPSFNSGLVWQPTDNETWRLLTGRAVQTPSLIEQGLQTELPFGPFTVLFAGNPHLKPSVSTNYEADYDYAFRQILSVLHTAFYYNETRDVLQFAPDLPLHFESGLVQSYSENTGNSQATGAELGLHSSDNAGFRWNASYSLVSVRTKTAYPAQTSYNNATPVSEIDLGAGYSWDRWEVDAQAHWQSNYEDYDAGVGAGGIFFTPVTVRNYITANARIGYQLTSRVTLALAGNQLAAAQTVESAGLEPERRILFNVTYGF